MTTTEKIKTKIEEEIKYADRDGSSKLSVCDHYNWDRDLWNYRHEIMSAIKNRGYNVSVSVNWGVTDIVTSKPLNL